MAEVNELSVKYFDVNSKQQVEFGRIKWNGKSWDITGKGSDYIKNLIGRGLFHKDNFVGLKDKELGDALLQLNASMYLIERV